MKSLRLSNLVEKLDEDFLWNLVVGGLEILVIICLLVTFDQFRM
jgi:hypothetical protein